MSSRPDRVPLGMRVRRNLAQRLDAGPRSVGEVVEVLRECQRRDVLTEDTLAMAEGVLAFAELQARDIMVPRSQMVSVSADDAPEKFVAGVVRSGHSRFPVIGDDRDQVLGILLAKDLLEYFASERSERFDIEDAMRPAVFIPEAKRLHVLLREFRERRNHMAIVVDEYGAVIGLVTIEDVLEQIVGEIDDEHDYDEPGVIRKLGEGEFIVKPSLSIEDFNEHFGTQFDDEEFDTIGGLIVNEFGRVPSRGDETYFGGWRFRVLHADKRRVHLLWLEAASPTTAAEEA